jgi:hypothetical protein
VTHLLSLPDLIDTGLVGAYIVAVSDIAMLFRSLDQFISGVVIK